MPPMLALRSLMIVGCLALAACGSSEEASTAEDNARENAVASLSTVTFEDVGDTSLCTEDCGGHDAGFEWARDNGITDESECSGNSDSFIEGCQAYVQQVEQQTEENKDDET